MESLSHPLLLSSGAKVLVPVEVDEVFRWWENLLLLSSEGLQDAAILAY